MGTASPSLLCHDLLCVNVTKTEVDEFLDTGYLCPFVVTPEAMKLRNTPFEVWCCTPESATKVSSGMPKWRRVTGNSDLWLYTVRVDPSTMSVEQASYDRDVVGDIEKLLRPQDMLLPAGMAMMGWSECKKDPMNDEFYWPSVRDYAQQVESVWYELNLHQSLKFRDKLVRGVLRAEDWWAAGESCDHG